MNNNLGARFGKPQRNALTDISTRSGNESSLSGQIQQARDWPWCLIGFHIGPYQVVNATAQVYCLPATGKRKPA
jgi:hypothetical protein